MHANPAHLTATLSKQSYLSKYHQPLCSRRFLVFFHIFIFLPKKSTPAKIVGDMSCSVPILPNSHDFPNGGIK
jgi:hypothetical protein